MDQTTKDAIIKHLLDIYLKDNRPFTSLANLHAALPNYESHILEATLRVLKAEGLVNYIIADNKPMGIRLTDSGLAYFEYRKEAKQAKWSERKWDLVQIVLGYGLGFVSGVGVSWVAHYLTR